MEKNAKKTFNDKILGQKIFYDDPENNPPVVEVSGIVKYKEDSYVCNLVPKNTVDVYVPVSMYYEKAQEHIDREALSYTFGVRVSCVEYSVDIECNSNFC